MRSSPAGAPGGESRSAVCVERPSLVRAPAAWLELVRGRIALFVVLAAFTGGQLAAGQPRAETDLVRVCLAAVLVGLVSASASAFNQILERDIDRQMQRTRHRPLPEERISVRDAVLFASALGAVGVAGLSLAFQPLSALLALATLAVYVLVYTPLKRTTSLNTVVGAVSGAMPPLLGYVALAGRPGPWGWILFGVVFAWQFPHFLAIAWLHREDYRRAGLRMLPALDGAQGLAGTQALLYSLCLLPVSLLPGLRGQAGWTFVLAALVLGLGYATAAAVFAWRESRASARAVLWASLFYLPALFSAVLLDRLLSPLAS